MQRFYEVKYFVRIRKLLKAEVSHVAGIVQREGVQPAMNYLNQLITIKGLPSVVGQLYREVGLRFARKQWMGFKEGERGRKVAVSALQLKGFGFNAEWVKLIRDYLYQFLLEKISFAVAETTRSIMLTLLNKAIAEGWGLDKTLQSMKDLPLSRTQAARIVRTEVTRAANAGVMAAGETYGWQQTKEWISAHDKRTRGTKPGDHASHVELDGITIDYEDEFTDSRNGDRLRFPGDPRASAASTINCRCALALVSKVDSNGRLLPKRRTTAVIYPGQIPRRRMVTI